MFFDTLAGIAERHLPEFCGVLSRARIFRLEPRRAELTVESAVENWDFDERTVENFRLPFDAVAFEEARDRDSAARSCSVLRVARPEDAAARRLQFLTADGTDKEEVTVAAGTLEALPDLSAGTLLGCEDQRRVARLTELRVWQGGKKAGVRPVECRLDWIGLVTPAVLVHQEADNQVARILAKHARGDQTWKDDVDRMKIAAGRYREFHARLATNLVSLICARSVLEVLVVNEPARFVVEEAPVSPARSGRPGVRRSADRPHYVVLTPKEIRARFIRETPEEEGERRRVTPHERRGHYRTMRSERFRNARGRTIWIDPLWVGPSEAVRGPNRYRVRLDL